VNAINSNRLDFANYNACFLQTPDNSFDKNLEALVTLRERLNQIKTMDPKTFEYQTAIQQITAQEQGEAHEMLGVIYGCYERENYPMIWEWIGALNILGFILLGIFGLFIISVGCI
jgi:hypothetical protein